MNENRLPPDNPHEWLNRAQSNLTQAKNQTAGVYFEDLCFNAQQAVEKAIKALLIHLKVRFPRTHNLVELLTLLEKAGRVVPSEIKESGILSDYAVESRYPGISEPVTQQEYKEAVAIAKRVVQWVKDILQT